MKGTIKEHIDIDFSKLSLADIYALKCHASETLDAPRSENYQDQIDENDEFWEHVKIQCRMEIFRRLRDELDRKNR